MGGGAWSSADAAMTDARGTTPGAVLFGQLGIRPARRDDVDAVAAIEKRAFSDPWSANSFVGLFGNPVVNFSVAEEAVTGRVLGYVVAWFVMDEAEIANLAVSDDARRAGVGARLLDHAVAAAAHQQCRVVFLEVRESNVAARALYASRGFEVAGRRSKYYRKPVEDALVLRRGM